jgi:hypothetical protein
MKRILLLAAGALGTAGMIAMAAPASAEEPSVASVPQPGQFQQNLQSQLRTFRGSIDPEEAVKRFLNGNCGAGANLKCPPKDPNPGVLNQFDYFRKNLQSQSKTFTDSIDRFVKGIPAPPSSDAAK